MMRGLVIIVALVLLALVVTVAVVLVQEHEGQADPIGTLENLRIYGYRADARGWQSTMTYILFASVFIILGSSFFYGRAELSDTTERAPTL